MTNYFHGFFQRGNKMARALGVGGIFFKAKDPKALLRWYQTWLGLSADSTDYVCFAPAAMPENSMTVFSPFKQDTDYFAPSSQSFMFNLVVDDLEEVLRQVDIGGGKRVGEIQKESYGSFGWFLDPEGNKVELWQPADGEPADGGPADGEPEQGA